MHFTELTQVAFTKDSLTVLLYIIIQIHTKHKNKCTTISTFDVVYFNLKYCTTVI
jgi:hypothetical protein